MLRMSAFGLLFVTLFAASSAQAQAEIYADPTDGVVLPAESITETRDATAISVNPANLAFLDSWSLVYTGSWLKEQTHVGGHGHGLFAAMPLGRFFSMGVATEFLMPPIEIESWQGLDDRIRFSLGMALNFNRAFALGLAYRTFWKYDLGELKTIDLGLTIQPSNYIALSFVASDVSAPMVNYYFGQQNAARGFNVGLTVRPFANDRLSLGGELNYLYGDSFTRTDGTALLSIMLIDGLTLRGRLGAEGIGDDSIETAYYMNGALEVDLPNFGFGMGMHGQVHPKGPAGYHGTNWTVRFSGDEAPSLIMPAGLRHLRVASIKLKEPLDGYRLARLVALFERIGNDKAVDMVMLQPEPDTIPLAYSEEVRRLLEGVNKAEKQTLCYLKEATSSVYLACAGADNIWINPGGGIRLSGLATSTTYFKGLFDKLGVKADFVRIGEYKGAPESFTRKSPTAPADFQINEYMDSTYASIIGNLASDRDFESRDVTKSTIEQGPFTAKEALAAGLVDKLVPLDTMQDELTELVEKPVFIDEHYGKSTLRHRRYLDAPAVAVIHINGSIVDGKSVDIPILDLKMAGSETLVEVIRQVKKDSRVKVVVLRIDSPGGSALASEIMWRELMALREEKPVIASMGSVAASGGYYLASAADEIYAESTTLTGSIGIFYGKFNVSGLFDKVGLDTKTYKRGPHADVDSMMRPYTPEERKRLMKQIQEYYDLFRQRVVEGRGRGFTPEIVDKLGRGRIWSGEDAKYYLLVDEIGGYQDALNRAREIGRIPQDIRVFHYPSPKRGLVTRLLTSAMSVVNPQSPLEQLFTTRGMKHMLRSILPFSHVGPESPRAALPFVLHEQ